MELRKRGLARRSRAIFSVDTGKAGGFKEEENDDFAESGFLRCDFFTCEKNPISPPPFWEKTLVLELPIFSLEPRSIADFCSRLMFGGDNVSLSVVPKVDRS